MQESARRILTGVIFFVVTGAMRKAPVIYPGDCSARKPFKNGGESLAMMWVVDVF